jgi:hypothetical protein
MAATYQTQSIFPDSYVGFDSITKQIEKKSVKRGFQFNVICVGKQSTFPACSRIADHEIQLQAKLVSASRRSSTPSSRRT